MQLPISTEEGLCRTETDRVVNRHQSFDVAGQINAIWAGEEVISQENWEPAMEEKRPPSRHGPIIDRLGAIVWFEVDRGLQAKG